MCKVCAFARIAACCILVVYLSLAYGIYVPDWGSRVQNVDSPNYGTVLTVTCGTRGKLNPPCNAVGYIDRKFLDINYMYQRPAWRRHRDCTDSSPHEGPFKNDAPAWCVVPFEPEGILSSFSAVLSTIIGVHYKHVLVHMQSHAGQAEAVGYHGHSSPCSWNHSTFLTWFRKSQLREVSR